MEKVVNELQHKEKKALALLRQIIGEPLSWSSGAPIYHYVY